MIIHKIKASERLEQILLNFIDVLRINIFMVDMNGNPLLMPKTNGYGWNLMAGKAGILQELGTPHLLFKFKKEGDYLVSTDDLGLQYFAIPVDAGEEIIGYLVIGPVILNKRLDQSKYQEITKKLGLDFNQFLEFINEVRVASFNSLKSVLDLLFDLSRYAIRLLDKEKSPQKERSTLTKNNNYVYKPLLDLAMALTEAERGSIMLFDKSSGELNIVVHKGLNSPNVDNIRVKVGEGIAGLAAQEKTSFIINHTSLSNNRIKHLLKKPELKGAVVMPIVKSGSSEVLGVINISTCQDNGRLTQENPQILKALNDITSRVLEQINN